MSTQLTTTAAGALVRGDLLTTFGDFIRLRVADGDASPATVQAYQLGARQFVTWCRDRGIDPATATEDAVIDYRRALVDAGYSRDSIALKLAAVRRLYEALAWRGYRADNPAAGLKAPRDKTDRAEKIKALTPDAARRLLASVPGDTDRAKRDRALVFLLASFARIPHLYSSVFDGTMV